MRDRFPIPNTLHLYRLLFAHAILSGDGGVFARGGVDEGTSER